MNFAEQIEFLSKIENINNVKIDNIIFIKSDKLIINFNLLNISELKSIPEGVLDNCIINGNIWLDDLTNIPKKFLRNTIVNGLLCLNSLEYLPKGFCPIVKNEILLNSLKSKFLKKLLFDPGSSRQLAFNLLKTI